jgi:secondary thiamine-phosphate synthase enzyme|tara:strand:- start:505 stop:954 length:450 start_codon:yes stop_codon:yes gene_type:complete
MIKRIKIETDKLFTDITEEISQFASDWGYSGIVNVFSPHTTMAVWLTEKEILHLLDIRFFLDSLAPKSKTPEGTQKNVKYFHDMISLREDVPADERVNGHSHIRHLFFNSSETIPIENGNLLLGEWKRIFAVELDPIRKRNIICSFIKS